MLTQVEADVFYLTMLDAVIDYWKDEAFSIPKADIHVVTRRGQKKLRKTTIGWSVLVQWADSYEVWIVDIYGKPLCQYCSSGIEVFLCLNKSHRGTVIEIFRLYQHGYLQAGNFHQCC